jgi:protein-tyrosine-phosphatase
MHRDAYPRHEQSHPIISHPGRFHPLVVKEMAEIGIDISRHRSKHLDEILADEVETVITICGNADQVCPVFPGQMKRVFEAYAAGRMDP